MNQEFVNQGFAYPFLEPLDPCLYGCSPIPQFSADAALPSWTDAGTPDPQTGGSPGYGSAPYDAQPAPYAGEGPEPNAVPYPAPYPTQPVYKGQPVYEGQAMGAPQPAVPAPSGPPPAPADEEEAVTLLFKDGRPPLQIRNYILTRSAVYLTGKHFYKIPLSDIDLQATQRVNWDAGVAFRLP